MAAAKANHARNSARLNLASVAVIIVNYRTAALTKRCLESIKPEKELLPKLEVVVVDGFSGDGSAKDLAKTIDDPEFRSWVSLLALEVNGGYGWANNQAIVRLLQRPNPPDFVHILNPDSEIDRGAVSALLNYLERHPKVAVVGSQLLEPDGSPAGSAFNFPTLRGEFARGARTAMIDKLLHVPSVALSASEAREVDWVTGASFMFRTEALKQVGLFDEGFFLYHEEVELMWRVRSAGWSIAFEPRSRVRHVGGAATGVHSRKSEARIQQRRPKYWYRSRARMLARTRGRAVALLAYAAWVAGATVWALRRAAGLANKSKSLSHQFHDHLRYAFPRRSDAVPAARPWDDQRSSEPAWMKRGWL